MADGARHPAAELGTISVEGTKQLALPPRSVRRSLGTQMDAAGHRTPKTQGRESVTIMTQGDPDLVAGGEHEPPALPGSRRVSAAEGYECWAPIYDEVPNPLLAREERHLLPLLTDLHNKSVLDVACGTGRWLERLMGQASQSGIGIDCSSAMLRIAGRKSAIKGRLVRADCENLPLPGAAFDLAS